MSEENVKSPGESGATSDVIIGVDILPGHSPSSSKQPHYAMAVLKDGKIIDKYEDISLSRLLRLIWEYKPSIIAIDNVYELAPSEHKLAKLFVLLPPGTSIVQVTGWGPDALNIKSMAKSIGINVDGKLSPLKTAILSALIAWKGYGYKVKLLEEKTKIIVVRGRSVSHGGMSYNRYIRSIRSGILAVAKEIKKILDRNGFDYDLLFKKAKGGLERAVFIVYAPREKLYGLIKPINTKSVRVIIKPVYKNKVVVGEDLRKSGKPVIVGIDPGVSTGIAVIDLNGVPLFLYSSKNIDRNDIINMISSIGYPVIIATDVAEAPDAVKKLAATVKAQLFVPPRNLSTVEKIEIVSMLTKKYPWLDIDDSHERDALAAAYKAYQSLEDKFRQIEKNLRKYGISLDEDRIKVAIIKGKTLAEAIEEELERIMEQDIGFTQDTSTPLDIKKTVVAEKKHDTSKRIDTRIKALEAEKKRLSQQIKDLSQRLEALELELRTLKSIKEADQETMREIEKLRLENKSLKDEVTKLKNTIEQLVNENKTLKQLLRIVAYENYIPVPVVKSPTLSNVIKSVENNVGLLKAIYVDDVGRLCNEVLKYLEENRVALIVGQDVENELLNDRIPMVSLKKFKHYIVDNMIFVEPSIIGVVDELWNIIEEKKKEDEYERILKLIEEYQEMRKKKLGLKGELSRL